MSDGELIARFEDTTLESLPHEDHVRLVYLYATQSGTDAAIERIRDGLIAFTAARGHSEAFHETRTWAWAVLITSATASARSKDFAHFTAAHPELLRRDLLDDYYSPALLASDLARTTILGPDLRAIA